METGEHRRHEPAPKARRRRLSRPAAWALTVVGALLVGAGGSQLLFSTAAPAERPTAPAAPTATPRPPDQAVVVPDVLGLDEVTARRVFLDAGISAGVTVTETPAAGAEGHVVLQDPAPGSGPAETIELVVSSPVEVPDVVGDTVDDARRTLEQHGAIVRVSRVVDLAATAGHVLASDPPAGDVLGTVIELTAADAGEAIDITDLRRIEGDRASTSSIALNGTAFERAIVFSVAPPRREGGDPRTAHAVWLLGRHAVALEATLGISDHDGEGRAHVRVLGDGELLEETEVSYGSTPTSLHVSTTDVLRLHVEVTPITGVVSVGLADARLLGSAEQLAAIEALE